MKRLLLILLLLPFLFGFGSLIDGVGIQYDLNWTGESAPDQTFTNTQVIDTKEEGRREGSLTAVKTSTGTVKVVGGKLEFVGDGADYEKTGLVRGAVTKALGKALFLTQGANASLSARFGFDTSAVADPTPNPWYVQRSDTDLYRFDTVGAVASITATQTYKLLLLLGGYDSNGIPFITGDTVGDFLYGARLFIKDGAFTTWTLLWLDATDNTGTLYPQFFSLDAVDKMTLDNILIPTNVLNVDTMFQPLFLDTFNTGTGSIDARDADIDYDSSGNGWTQRIADADWRIDTNTAELGVTGSDPANNADWRYVYVDVGAGDFIFEADVKYEATGGNQGIMFRGSAETGSGVNMWTYTLSTASGASEFLVERNDGGGTVRDSAVHGCVDQTSYKLTVIASGTTIRCYRDGALKLEYTSATHNQTATWMGLFADGNANTDKAFDNVAIFPITGFDNAISAGTGGTY